jgi:hypothetical protein
MNYELPHSPALASSGSNPETDLRMIEGFQPGALVIVNLVNPKEKFWGAILSLTTAGVTLRGISLESFPDWVRQLAHETGEPNLDLATMFVPMFRVERIFLDEPVGSVKSYSEYFHEVVGVSPDRYIGITSSGDVEGVH